MPINEASGPKRSNLTREQKREAERALYGLSEQSMQPQLTPEDYARMRAMLDQYDQKSKPSEGEFDLNRPPSKPYRHQEFPKVVYLHDTGDQKLVHNEHQEAAHIEAGWKNEPFAAVEVDTEPHLDADAQREIAAVDAQLVKKSTRKPKPAEE